MRDALIAIHHDVIAIQRLGGDPLGMDHQRNRQRTGHDRGMASDRAFFQHDAVQVTAIFQQFPRSDIARHKNRVCGQFGPGFRALPGQDAQQPVGQVIQIVQPLAQIGVCHLLHAFARRRLFLFHRRLGAQAPGDVLLHALHPALGIGKHPVGFQHVQLFAVAPRGGGQHLVHAHAQFLDRLAQAQCLFFGVVGHRVGDNHTRLVQPDTALGGAFLPAGAPEYFGLLVARGHRRAFAHKGAQFGHFGQHHGDHFQRIDLVRGIAARVLGLHHQHPQVVPQALDRNAAERGIDLLAGLRHEAKALFGGRIIRVDHTRRARHTAHQALTHAHPGLVHGVGAQTFGGAKLQCFAIAEQVDRTHFGAHRGGNQPGDPVQPFLPGGLLGQRIAQAPKQLAAFGFGAFRHGATGFPCWLHSG